MERLGRQQAHHSGTGGQERHISARLDDPRRPAFEADDLQALGSIDLCYPPSSGAAVPNSEWHQELADEVAAEMESRRAAPQDPSDVRFRLHCFLLWESKHVEFVDMGFRDCWYAAVASYASTHISLRNSVIEGSTWGFLAVGRRDTPQTAHSFEVTGNLWKQSPASYRQNSPSCDVRNDWIVRRASMPTFHGASRTITSGAR
jgi:hypothetical protein